MRAVRRTRRAHGAGALLIASLLWVGGLDEAGAQVRNFKHYTAFEGVPQAQVLSTAQDSRGYVWFATYGGLSRFNGSEFRTWTTADGLTSNSVFDIAVDGTDRLLIATSGGACVMEDERFHCYREADGLVNDYVRSVVPDGQGGMWVGTSRGVSHVTPSGIRSYTMDDGLPAERVGRVAVDSAGGVWATTDLGLYRLSGERFVPDSPEHFAGRAVQFVTPVTGGVLVGSEGRLFLRRDGGTVPVAEGLLPEDAQLVDGVIDGAGTIWVATRTGALRIAGQRVEQLTERHGLLNNLVNHVSLDREGDVWFGTESGASKHVPGPFTTYTMNEGLPSPFVRAVEVGPAGDVWVGTRNGVAVFDEDAGRFRSVELEGLPDSRVYGLGRSPDGGMLIGVRGGLGYLKDGALRVYGEKHGLPGAVVYALVPDGRGGMWVSTDRGLARWENGELTRIDQPDLNELSILSMATDDRGRVWLGRTNGGIAIWDGATLETIGPEDGLSDQSVWTLAMDAQGRMWAGTNGDGAYRIGPAGIERFTQKQGLASDFIWQVMPDSRGDVWLFGNAGLDRLTADGLTHYGRGSGLIELEGSVSAVREDSNGDLWFGSGSGVVRYVPGLDVPPAHRPPIYVEVVTHDGEPVIDRPGASPDDGRLRLRDGAVRITFGSPSFRDESVIRYRYRLVGSGDSWSAPLKERSITYAGLNPGHYNFEVVADNRGLRSETPATFAFTIVPAFWQTWTFRIIGALLLATAAGSVPAMRARGLEKERRRLEALVAQHTRELAEKNERLQHSNRDLEHFAYVASHDLQEPLRKIRAFSDRVSTRYAALLDDQGRDYLARTANAASRMQQLIDDLLTLSRLTTKRKPTELIEFGSIVRDVVADLEIRIQSTGGRVEVGKLPDIDADPAQIRQLMQNLIGNALKFHRPDEPPVVRVSASPAGPGRIEIRVEDNGIGFDSADAQKLFLPFQRLHPRMQYEGTGIGLSICQKIVERHGGTIRAESEPGRGSKFIVILPEHQPVVEAHAA
jgi:signal transduction histidine kinase/ligand-binding sensor domain-containing protein